MATAAAKPAADTTPEPFVPTLCQGCTRFPGCSKLALVQYAAPGQEIAECGIYSPVRPAQPDKE